MNVLALATKLFGVFGEGRSPAALLNFGVPRTGYTVQRDIAYGDHRRHRLDLYLPTNSPGATTPRPLLVFFYGGAFRAGRRDEYRFAGEAFASAGIPVAIPDYRIYPEARFPDFLRDGAAAVTKARDVIRARGENPAGLFVMGHSAGAYIAVMLAANASWLAAAGDARISGAIALSGRYHYSPLQDSVAERIFGGPARAETRPATFITPSCPPMFIASGSREPEILHIAQQKLAADLR